MNDGTKPANHVFKEMCSLGMGQVVGTEKTSLDVKKKAWFVPVLGYLLGTVAKAFASCLESQWNWLSPRTPRASSQVGTVASNASGHSKPSPDELAYSMDIAIGPQQVAAPRSTAVSSSVRKAQPQPTPDELAYSMDIALGAQFTVVPGRTVASSSGSRLPAAEVPEPGRELAMTAKAGG